MKRMFSLLVVIVFCMQIGVGNGRTTLAAEQPKLTDIETDRVIVKMKPTAKESSLKWNRSSHSYDEKKPSDPHYTKQYHHKLIQTEKAWDKTKGSKSIIVAVIDNGADLNHPDLKGKFYASNPLIW